MNQIPNGWQDFLREQFPEGSRIMLREMKNDPNPVPPGSMGTLQHIDSTGTFHVRFDNGRELGVILGEDSFTVLPPPTQTLKLYMPMTIDVFEANEWGDMEEEPLVLDAHDAVEYAPQVIAALQNERMPEEVERGMMTYYHEDDGVNRKVQSYVFTAEVRDGQLWGVAECKVQGQLTPEELGKLIDNVSGQASDGFGEGFEQRSIEQKIALIPILPKNCRICATPPCPVTEVSFSSSGARAGTFRRSGTRTIQPGTAALPTILIRNVASPKSRRQPCPSAAYSGGTSRGLIQRRICGSLNRSKEG